MCSSILNVLIIAQYFPPDLGGAATRAYNVAKGLHLNKCEVTVVTAFPHYPHGKIPKQYRWRPLRVEYIECTKVVRTFILPLESKGLARRILLFMSFAISSLFALPLVGKTDVVWAANPDILSMMPAMIYSKVKRRPIVSNVDDLVLKDLYDLNLMEEGSTISKLAELMARISYLKAEAVTPVSPGYVEYLSKRYGVEKSKIHMVRGGVDLTTFKPRAFQQNARARFIVLYSGAFSVAYDFEQVLTAAKIVGEKDSEVKFILQGKGELATSIKSKIKELNLKNVRVVDKLFTRDEVGELLNQADTLILPLRDFGKPYLGMSSKLYEYQAAGKPTICCAEGQPADYIKGTNSGVVVKPGDFKGLAEGVVYLYHNGEVAKRLGEAGRHFVEENLSLEKIGSRMVSVFRQVLGNPFRIREAEQQVA